MKLHLTPEQAALMDKGTRESPDVWHLEYTLCCGYGISLTPRSALRPVRGKPDMRETVFRPVEAP